ncbi:MAG: NmrA family NAD(P)-binding protein [Verrucomicrobia bacterium]|nr:NmrA family NAD(P)-binding protein [Verrucomicrobiota bacterium]
MSTSLPFRTLLVMGASGQLGRRVVDLLMEARAGRVIAASRNPDKLANYTLCGAEVRAVDLDDPASLDAVCKGVHRILLINTEALDVSGRRLQQHRNAIDAAVRAGVQHLVYTSISNASADSTVPGAADHHATEQMLAGTRLGWSVLRKNIYAEDLLPALARAVATGRWEAAAGEGAAAYVTREDYAQSVAAALGSSFDGHRILDITGPMAVTHGMIARWVTETTGKPVTYVPAGVPALAGGSSAESGDPQAELQAALDAAIARGEFAKASRAVSELVGRPPMNVPAFLRAHRPRLMGE